MANLQEPTQREGAILFCDLCQSAPLSRQLPTARYFKLVRGLWTGIDRVVADELGIVGKHAGDGASAFFLVENLGSRSRSATAAIRAARRIHEIVEEVAGDVIEGAGAMRVGIHWGAQLYIGQLVPGGRLDVAALGDDVNEGARIQEAAPPGGPDPGIQAADRTPRARRRRIPRTRRRQALLPHARRHARRAGEGRPRRRGPGRYVTLTELSDPQDLTAGIGAALRTFTAHLLNSLRSAGALSDTQEPLLPIAAGIIATERHEKQDGDENKACSKDQPLKSRHLTHPLAEMDRTDSPRNRRRYSRNSGALPRLVLHKAVAARSEPRQG